MTITIKTLEEQEKMRKAGRLAANVLDMIGDYIEPGISTNEPVRILLLKSKKQFPLH